MKLILHLFVFSFSVIFCGCVIERDFPYIFTDPNVINGNSFINYIHVDNNTNINSCSLLYYIDKTTNGSIELSLQTIRKPINSLKDYKGLRDRIESIGQGLCGITFRNYVIEDPKIYWLKADYTENNVKNQTILNFNVSTTNAVGKNETQILQIGEKSEIVCAVRTQISCAVYNPMGELVYKKLGTNCKYPIPIVRMDHIGVWKCVHNVWVALSSVNSYIYTRLSAKKRIGTQKVTKWFDEKDGIGKIGCKHNVVINSDTKFPDYCKITSPTKEEFAISTPGHVTDRYSAIGTNLANFTCQIEFKTPLLKEEKGAWLCEIDFTGGFIYPSAEIPDFPKLIKQGIDLTDKDSVNLKKFDIMCNVPYSMETCSIKSPSGETYSGGVWELGQCSFSWTNIEVNASYIGNWYCHVSRPDSSIEDIITTEVYQLDSLTAVTKEIEADANGPVELLCKSHLPILYCRFVDPSGNNSYTLSPDKSTKEMRYFGRGLEYGDCGMEITLLKKEHQGTWSCSVLQGGDTTKKDEERTAKIELAVDSGGVGGMSTASSIGIPVGIMAAALVLLGAAMYKRFVNKRKEQSRIDSRSSQASNASDSSATSLDLL